VLKILADNIRKTKQSATVNKGQLLSLVLTQQDMTPDI
jgi:hypothetical protein